MKRYIRHGCAKMTRHPLYNLYYRIKTRCYNASAHNYPYYQGKGIKMCQEWVDSFQCFYKWCLDNGWKKGLSIDRIDSNGDYCPANCRFITLSENSKKARKENPYKPFRKNNTKIARSKLTLEQVIEIKKRILAGERGYEIAKLYGVDRSAIYKIKDNKRWAYVQIPCS